MVNRHAEDREIPQWRSTQQPLDQQWSLAVFFFLVTPSGSSLHTISTIVPITK